MNLAAILTIFIIGYYLFNRKAIISNRKISLKDFEELESDTYELIFIGKEKQFERLEPNKYKTYLQKEIKAFKKVSKEELPFDFTKEIIISTLSPDNVVLFNELASKKKFDYKFLAEVEITK